MPFAAFISAEHLHASGVLAVVVAGFVVGHGSLDAGYQTRLQERYVWNSVDVMLEAFVFAYIGLQLRFVLEDLREAHESLTEVALASGVVLVVVLLIRPACVFLMFGRGLLSRHVENRLSVPVPVVGARGALGTRKRKRGKWSALIDRRLLTWQESVVVSWTGMRGVVTLAAASGIPLMTTDGQPFPERATIQAIAFAVSVGTLLLQGWTLPLLIRWLGPSFEADRVSDDAETRKAEQIVHTAADDVLARFAADPPAGLDAATLANIRLTIARHSQDADEMPDPESHTLRAEVFSSLYREVLAAQRTRVDRRTRRGPHRGRSRARHARAARPSGGRRVSAPGKPVLTIEPEIVFKGRPKVVHKLSTVASARDERLEAAEVSAAEVAAADSRRCPSRRPSRRHQPPPSQPPPSPPPSSPPSPSPAAVGAVAVAVAVALLSKPWAS